MAVAAQTGLSPPSCSLAFSLWYRATEWPALCFSDREPRMQSIPVSLVSYPTWNSWSAGPERETQMSVRLMRVLISALCLCASPLFASDLALWGDFGAWSVLVNPATGNGCFAQKTFEDGTLVQIGAEPSRNGGFFAAYNADWDSIETGASGTVQFDFGDALFAGNVVGRNQDGLPGGYAFFDNPNFVTEFAKRRSVKISGESGSMVEIDLGGTKTAIDSVLACQEEQPELAAE